MKTVQKIGYTALASATLAHQTYAIDFGANNVNSKIKGSDQTADTTIQNLIGNAMLFLAILAVCYGIYGGFQILTAGGDENKVKTGRTILFQVALGLVVIFLANSIVQFVLSKILTPGS